jgi:hypothetical protein
MMSSNDREKWTHAAVELQNQCEVEKATWSEIDNATLARYVSGTAATEEREKIEAALKTHPHLRDLVQIIQETLLDSSAPSHHAGDNERENDLGISVLDDLATPSGKLGADALMPPKRGWLLFPLSISPHASKIAAIVSGGVLSACLAICLLSQFLFEVENPELTKARQDFARAQRDLEDLKRSIQQKETMKEALLAQQKQFDAEKRIWLDKMEEDRKSRQRELDYQREQDLKNAAIQNDKILAAKNEENRRRKQQDLDRQTGERLAEKEKADLELQRKLTSLQSQLDAANQKAQQATISVSQTPPPVNYPPYHWRNYWGW